MIILNLLKKYLKVLLIIIPISCIPSCSYIINKAGVLPKVNEPYTFVVTTKYKENNNNYLFGEDRKVNVTEDTYKTSNVGDKVTFDNYVDSRQYNLYMLYSFLLCITFFACFIAAIIVDDRKKSRN